jgi:hypothetical protein
MTLLVACACRWWRGWCAHDRWLPPPPHPARRPLQQQRRGAPTGSASGIHLVVLDSTNSPLIKFFTVGCAEGSGGRPGVMLVTDSRPHGRKAASFAHARHLVNPPSQGLQPAPAPCTHHGGRETAHVARRAQRGGQHSRKNETEGTGEQPGGGGGGVRALRARAAVRRRENAAADEIAREESRARFACATPANGGQSCGGRGCEGPRKLGSRAAFCRHGATRQAVAHTGNGAVAQRVIRWRAFGASAIPRD